MDESWRIRMGASMPTASTSTISKHQSSNDNRRSSSELEPEDFDDVFGGPPRSVLARKLSADFSHSDWFYDEIFGHPEIDAPAPIAGRRLPGFVIPDGGGEGGRTAKGRGRLKCLSRSKSTSSSALSFEETGELSPYLPANVGDEDVALSSYTSKLRPINVPYRWSSSTTSVMQRTKHNKRDLPPFGCNNTTYVGNHHFNENNQSTNHMIKSFHFGLPPRVSSPEVLVMDNHNTHVNSPSSPLSYVCHVNEDNMSYQQQGGEVQEREIHGVMSSYFMEMNTRSTEANNNEANDMDEAIAWAREKFQGWSIDANGIELQR